MRIAIGSFFPPLLEPLLVRRLAAVMMHHGAPAADDKALTHVLRLRVDGRQKGAECPAHPVQLVDQVEDYANALIVYADVMLQVMNQLCPCDVEIGELLPSSLAAAYEPTRRNEGFQSLGFKAGAT